ncbi:MAG: nucleoside 2-deoxyribosyltransferase [Candidatus Dormibacteria bacterium]
MAADRMRTSVPLYLATGPPVNGSLSSPRCRPAGPACARQGLRYPRPVKVYIASPLGFSAAGRLFLEQVEAHVRSLGHEVVSPWDDPEVAAATAAGMDNDRLVHLIGSRNAARIAAADAVLACLDGMEPDSGTAAEVGYATALGKTVFGLRTDSRPCGDFPGLPLNAQLLYFVEASGGRLSSALSDVDLRVTG